MEKVEKTKKIFMRDRFCFFIIILLKASSVNSKVLKTNCINNAVKVDGKYFEGCEGGYINEKTECEPYRCSDNIIIVNQICQPQENSPINVGKQCVTPSPAETSTISHPEAPSTNETNSDVLNPAELNRCPPDSIFTHGKCRKIICPHGEYYKGRCLQAICPEGLVWRGQRCQEPGFVTTIVQIKNVIHNEAHRTPGEVIPPWNLNNVIHDTTEPNMASTVSALITVLSSTTTTTPIPETGELDIGFGCCKIITPRVCKVFGKKWVCFHRTYKRCDPKLCKHSVIYLKVTNVTYESPILIMPPNPPLIACKTPNCDETDAVDCSGCAHGRRDTCSSYCYQYLCLHDKCNFINLQDYCADYPGEPGCTKMDGCIWDWCKSGCQN